MNINELYEISFRNRVDFYQHRLRRVHKGAPSNDVFTPKEIKTHVQMGVFLPYNRKKGGVHVLSEKAVNKLEELSKMNTTKPDRAYRTKPRRASNNPEPVRVLKGFMEVAK